MTGKASAPKISLIVAVRCASGSFFNDSMMRLIVASLFCCISFDTCTESKPSFLNASLADFVALSPLVSAKNIFFKPVATTSGARLFTLAPIAAI